MDMSDKELFASIFKEKYARFTEGESDSPRDWIHALGKASDALLYSSLFMPETIEVCGSVLLELLIYDQSVKSDFLSCLNKKGKKIAEMSFNFIEVGYLFAPSGRDTTDEEDHLLACAIRDSWAAWLSFKYPGRLFKVEVLSEDVTGSTVGVHFYEEM